MTAPQPDPKRPETPPPGHGHHLFLSAFRQRADFFWHRVGRPVPLALLLLVLALVYLGTVGFPPAVVRYVNGRLKEEGVPLTVRKVRFYPLIGVAADGLRFTDPGAPGVVLAEAGTLAVTFNPLDLLAGESGLRGVKLKRLSVNVSAGDPANAQTFRLQRLEVQLRVEPRALKVRRLKANVCSVVLQGSGEVALVKPGTEKRISPAEWARQIARSLAGAPPWVVKTLEEVNAARFGSPPRAVLSFSVHPTNFALTEAALKVSGYETEVRKTKFDEWKFEGTLKDHRLAVSSLSLYQGRRHLDVSGSTDLDTRMLEGRLFSSLEPTDCVRLMPAGWQKTFGPSKYRFKGPVTLEASVGPAFWSNATERVRGWVSLRRGMVQGIWFDRAYAEFKREGSRYSVDKVDAVLGRDRQRGVLQGWMWFDTASRDYRARARMGFDPHAVLPVMNPHDEAIINSFEFPGGPPLGVIEFCGTEGVPENFRLWGTLQAQDFEYNGAPVALFDSGISYTRGTLVFDPMLILRTDGQVEGVLAIDFDHDTADVDALSTAHPYMVARLIDDSVEDFIRGFRFEGPTRIRAKGRIDYGAHATTDLKADVEGRLMGMAWALADRCSFKVHAVGPDMRFDNVDASLFGGALTGNVTVCSMNQPSNTGYAVQANIRQADFTEMSRQMSGTNTSSYEGRLSAAVDVTGIMGEGQGRTAFGEGWVVVSSAYLFKIPLLGELTKLLSHIHVSLSFLDKTDFSARFKMADGKVHTEDADLEGSVVSIRAQGDYAFNQELDMTVRVQLLRGGFIADVARFFTSPVTKLLEFHLGGTLAKPKWRPVNLPKELFLIFD